MKIVKWALVVGMAVLAVGLVQRRKLRSDGPAPALDRLTKQELYRRAQAARVPGRSQMNKADLIAALRASGGTRSGAKAPLVGAGGGR